MVTTRSHLARPPPIQWKQRDDNALVEQTAGLTRAGIGRMVRLAYPGV